MMKNASPGKTEQNQPIFIRIGCRSGKQISAPTPKTTIHKTSVAVRCFGGASLRAMTPTWVPRVIPPPTPTPIPPIPMATPPPAVLVDKLESPFL
jgi:hypothetical protein